MTLPTLRFLINVPLCLFFSGKNFYPYGLIRNPTVIKIWSHLISSEKNAVLKNPFTLSMGVINYYPLRLSRPLRLLISMDMSTPYG